MIWESQGNRTATEIITSHLQPLQGAGLFSNKSLFLIVISSRVSETNHEFSVRILEDLWHTFKIIDVTLVIPYINATEKYTRALLRFKMAVQKHLNFTRGTRF
jgi:hypothetical protein